MNTDVCRAAGVSYVPAVVVAGEAAGVAVGGRALQAGRVALVAFVDGRIAEVVGAAGSSALARSSVEVELNVVRIQPA